MIKNFHQVRDNLYRSGVLTAANIIDLKRMGINKIISLDEYHGKKISSICQKLNINHIIIDIDPDNINSIKNLLKYNINNLIDPDISTLIHCFRGKDRTGLLVALIRCIFDNWDCKKAIKEAKMLGFGTGLVFPIEKFYIKLICRSCKSKHIDTNHVYDIVSNMTDLDNMYRDEQFDPYPTWASIADINYRTYPEAFVNPYYHEPLNEQINFSTNQIPRVGIYNQNTQITNMVGPSLVGGGFL